MKCRQWHSFSNWSILWSCSIKTLKVCTFDIESHYYPASVHTDTGKDGTARGVAHYDWFCKYLGLASLSWFGYFTLLAHHEHLRLNLLNLYCATPRELRIPSNNINAWFGSYIIVDFFIFNMGFMDVLGVCINLSNIPLQPMVMSLEMGLVFLETSCEKKAPVISRESLGRSVIIDLGSQRA